MDFINAIVLLLNYIFVPALTYGSQLALGTVDDATAIAKIFINTNLAACGGVIANALITRFLTGKTDVIMMLNGC